MEFGGRRKPLARFSDDIESNGKSRPRSRQDDAYVVREGPVFHERPPSGHDIALQRGAIHVVDLCDGRRQRGAVDVLPEKLPWLGQGQPGKDGFSLLCECQWGVLSGLRIPL
jgi:hypothetical protein